MPKPPEVNNHTRSFYLKNGDLTQIEMTLTGEKYRADDSD